MSELFSPKNLRVLEERMADLKMRELFEEPSSYEDEDDEDPECHY